MKKLYELPDFTIVKVVITNKTTMVEEHKKMTYQEWKNLIKDQNYYYKAYQI